MTMTLLVLLGAMAFGCTLVVMMAALSYREAEREIKQLARQPFRLPIPPRRQPQR